MSQNIISCIRQNIHNYIYGFAFYLRIKQINPLMLFYFNIKFLINNPLKKIYIYLYGFEYNSENSK